VPARRRGEVIPSQLGLSVHPRQHTIQQVRIVPRTGYDVVAVVSERAPLPAAVPPAWHAGGDLGLTTWATRASDRPGFVPRMVNGRPVKSLNQCSNQRTAEVQSRLGHPGTTTQMARLTAHRTRQIDHDRHTASRRSIDVLVAEGIGTLVSGQNPWWKQQLNLGQRTNQQVVSIPLARCVAMLRYTAALVGMQVNVTEESDTSKATFLDADPLPVYDAARPEQPRFSGRRVKRGRSQAAHGRRLNADVNGAYTILRQTLPDALRQGIAGAAVHPTRLAVRTQRAA
jgi:putative transposase